MPQLLLTTEISAPAIRCFNLSLSIDLHKISTAHTGEEAIAGVTKGLIGPGETVIWRARHFGIRQTFTSKITSLVPGISFTDEMLQGAFKSFKHDHSFREQNGKTLMLDEVNYESPFGALGHIANSLVLNRYLYKLLKQRNIIIKHYSETELWKNVLV